jgi:REP element-mobilizing transposase RayT
MSLTKIYVHGVFGTKYRMPVLQEQRRGILLQHIRENAIEKSICIDTINGAIDHIHILLKLSSDQSVKTVMQLIKGESSRWSNEHIIFREKLIWSRGYYAASVDPARIGITRRYIATQEAHHYHPVQAYLQSLFLADESTDIA